MNLIDGTIKFMESDFGEYEGLFKELGRKQNPHTLFIGCADSRVVPNLITGTLPGELFVVRNIANIVPPYRISDEFLATTSAIEYAINALNVKNIVVCGHSNCGGCEAIYHADKLKKLPSVAKWLTQLNEIKHAVNALNLSPAKREWITERLNVINSLKNLLTFPGVREKIERNELKIYGWHYIIETGQVFAYDGSEFKLLENKENSGDIR